MKHIAMILILASIPSAAVFAADAAAGKAVFDAKCKMCHGPAGAGGVMDKTPIAGTDAATVKATVTSGKGKMKPQPAVSGDGLDNVAAYVASLKK
jgi:cytochrome c oxidase cbb3-type subunit 3